MYPHTSLKALSDPVLSIIMAKSSIDTMITHFDHLSAFQKAIISFMIFIYVKKLKFQDSKYQMEINIKDQKIYILFDEFGKRITKIPIAV